MSTKAKTIPPSQFRVFTLGSADLKCDDVIEVCTVPSQFAAPFSTLQIGTSNVPSFLPDFSQLTIDYNYFWLNISHLRLFFKIKPEHDGIGDRSKTIMNNKQQRIYQPQ